MKYRLRSQIFTNGEDSFKSVLVCHSIKSFSRCDKKRNKSGIVMSVRHGKASLQGAVEESKKRLERRKYEKKKMRLLTGLSFAVEKKVKLEKDNPKDISMIT